MARAGYDPKTGADARVTQALIIATNDPSADVRLEAVMAIGAMGEPVPKLKAAAIAALRARLRDRDVAVEVWAHASLMALEKVTEKDLVVLAKYLQAKESRTKVHAVRAMSTLGKDAKPKVPEMVALLRDKDFMVQLAAAYSLGELGKKIDPGTQAMVELTEVLKKKDIEYPLKVTVEDAIAKIKGDVKDKDKDKPKN